mmetsp:Transcript_50469/g.110368  ORF Transcript_50469/g.110368 Transcript_50469/m.110368 type:complete len:298 (-) Transcript_50469:151-1044(-)
MPSFAPDGAEVLHPGPAVHRKPIHQQTLDLRLINVNMLANLPQNNADPIRSRQDAPPRNHPVKRAVHIHHLGTLLEQAGVDHLLDHPLVEGDVGRRGRWVLWVLSDAQQGDDFFAELALPILALGVVHDDPLVPEAHTDEDLVVVHRAEDLHFHPHPGQILADIQEEGVAQHPQGGLPLGRHSNSREAGPVLLSHRGGNPHVAEDPLQHLRGDPLLLIPQLDSGVVEHHHHIWGQVGLVVLLRGAPGPLTRHLGLGAARLLRLRSYNNTPALVRARPAGVVCPIVVVEKLIESEHPN